MKAIRLGLSPWARNRINNERGKPIDGSTAFTSAVETSYPYVDKAIIDAIYRINRRFQIVWEMQASRSYMWHIYLHRTDGKTDEPLHFYLVRKEPGYEFAPLDWRVVDRIRQVQEWSNDPVVFVRYMNAEQERLREIDEKDQDNELDAMARHYRRLFARLADETPDCRWERGIGRRADGTYYAEGGGATGRDVTTALAGEKRA